MTGAQSVVNKRKFVKEEVREENREQVIGKLIENLHLILVVIGSHWTVLSKGVK